ncbi:hypothetical protein MTO96_049226 [Rhipicephalus appendiculatus]
MLGTRVVVPAKLQGFVLDELHDGHPGIVRSKELARSYLWWPTLEADLERRIKSCASCQEQLRSNRSCLFASACNHTEENLHLASPPGSAAAQTCKDVTPMHGTAGKAMTSEFLVFPETVDAPVPPRATPVTPQATPAPAEARRYPMRNRRPPDRFQAGL